MINNYDNNRSKRGKAIRENSLSPKLRSVIFTLIDYNFYNFSFFYDDIGIL